jgi:hypothetical protein
MSMNDDDAPATKGEVRGVQRTLALEIVKTNARMDAGFDAVRSEIRMSHSMIVNRIDEYMGQVGKVDRAQIIADWRLGELEKRVKTLETPDRSS